jgi:hypothetical protein
LLWRLRGILALRDGPCPGGTRGGRHASPAPAIEAGLDEGRDVMAGEARGAAGSPDEAVLLVAVCAGHRCQALRALHEPSAAGSGSCGQLLKEAVRRNPRAVLISTRCLGPCARGCVAAVGSGTATEGGIHWTGRPVGLGMIEMPERAAALAAWITSSAPDLATLPEVLWSIAG